MNYRRVLLPAFLAIAGPVLAQRPRIQSGSSGSGAVQSGQFHPGETTHHQMMTPEMHYQHMMQQFWYEQCCSTKCSARRDRREVLFSSIAVAAKVNPARADITSRKTSRARPARRMIVRARTPMRTALRASNQSLQESRRRVMPKNRRRNGVPTITPQSERHRSGRQPARIKSRRRPTGWQSGCCVPFTRGLRRQTQTIGVIVCGRWNTSRPRSGTSVPSFLVFPPQQSARPTCRKHDQTRSCAMRSTR
jgi:hypothetical protein